MELSLENDCGELTRYQPPIALLTLATLEGRTTLFFIGEENL